LNYATSIIHGAKSIGTPIVDSTVWVTSLARYIEHNNHLVFSYYWSGKIAESCSQLTIKEYAEHLFNLSLYGKRQVNIYAKSLGVVIAEKAISYLYDNNQSIDINKFIRVGSPISRNLFCEDLGNKNINIQSSSDYLCLLGRLVIEPFYCSSYLKSENVKNNICINGLSHSDFNRSDIKVSLPTSEVIALFELYKRLLEGNIHIHKKQVYKIA